MSIMMTFEGPGSIPDGGRRQEGCPGYQRRTDDQQRTEAAGED